MGKKPINLNPLRVKAEAQLATESVVRPTNELLYEFQVHQIELEMQNEELRSAHLALEEAHNRYVDLYDFAPVGYLTLTRKGLIAEVNLTATELLGAARKNLLSRHFAAFVTPKDGDRWHLFFSDAMKHNERQNTELTLKRHDDTEFPVQLDCLCVMSGDKNSMLRIALIDITHRKVIEDKINKLAFFDPLTQLPNRVLLAEHMHQTLARCRRNQEIAAVCMLDLDGFKQVNDTLGHAAGDQLLCDVAQRLQECIREEDTAARFGGDEFALLLSGFTTVSECKQTLERIVAAIAVPYRIFDQMAHISASVGVTLFPEDSSDPDILLRHADQAMYEVKKTSKNGYQLFNSVDEKCNQTKHAFLKKIDEALVKGQFELYYQPMVDCHQGKVVGAEALVRWNHPILGILAPSEFIPVIEHDDLIITLGEWTIQQALWQLNEWREAGINIQINVNISARQLHNLDFLQRLQELLASYNSDIIEQLKIEVVETAALKDVIFGEDAIRKCRAMGVCVTLDDFGTGFLSVVQSLVRLQHMVVDTLKVDLSFVSNMLTDPKDMAVVEGVIGLAASSHLQVIAKGVEYVDQIIILIEMGCDVIQGYGLARPMPANQMRAWLAAFTPDPRWRLSASYLTSRDCFELLLMGANIRYWVNRVIANLDDPLDHTTPESLLDHHQCQFGQWYYGEGAIHYRNISDFQSLDAVHQNIHQIAARLCEHHQAGMEVEADTDKAQLLAQLQNLTSLIHRLLADELLRIANT